MTPAPQREGGPREEAAPNSNQKLHPQDATPAANGKVQSAAQRLEVRAPAFQFYPADYLADMRIRMLSWASRGLYIDLLCYCWREGWIPSDSSAIAQLCHCHDTAIIEPCLALFFPHPDDPGKLIHLSLEAEREKQKAFREERKASGIKGAVKRWGRDSSAIKEPMAKNGSSSSIFSLQSSDVPPTPPRGNRGGGSVENSPLMIRIGKFLNRKPTTRWDEKERKALKALLPVDPEAVDLVEGYYLADIPEEKDIRRKSIQTLLNNWNGELDRATLYATSHK
jgi:hypothetical protein